MISDFFADLAQRNGPAYGAGPTGFKRLMHRLGDPQNSYSIIHVAGTNGKGSVCYLLAQVLQEAGYKTGLFVSPHLQSPRERIQINGHLISRAALERLYRQVVNAEEEKLNFFEILTAIAFLYFAQKKVKYVVLETGLGGHKDPTNICKPVACAITSIGLDHCQVLGNTLTQIAQEKAGIIKPKTPVFCPPLPTSVQAVISQRARQQSAPCYELKEADPFSFHHVNWRRGFLYIQKGKTRWKLGVLGEKQLQNACLVYQICKKLAIAEQAIRKGFSRVHVPGRFEIVHLPKHTVILDGAHNPQAMGHLLDFLQKSPWKQKMACICGFMQDKDYPAMLKLLSSHIQTIGLTSILHPRAVAPAQLKAGMPASQQIAVYNRPTTAWKAISKQHNTILVTGSFYLVGWFKKYLQQKAHRTVQSYARVARKD